MDLSSKPAAFRISVSFGKDFFFFPTDEKIWFPLPNFSVLRKLRSFTALVLLVLVPDAAKEKEQRKGELWEDVLLGVISTPKGLFLLFYAFGAHFPFPT